MPQGSQDHSVRQSPEISAAFWEGQAPSLREKIQALRLAERSVRKEATTIDLKLNFDKHDHAQTIQGWVIPISGAEEIAQRIRLRLTIRRGSFPLDPDLGSRLYALPRGTTPQMNAAAREIIEEALAPMPGVRLTSVSCAYDPEADKATLTCRFTWSGQDIPIVTEV